MRRRAGAVSAVVVILAAAGTATALLVAGSGDRGDYKALPTCEKLSAVLPGRPPLKAEDDLTSQPLERGLDPAFMDLQCAYFNADVVSTDTGVFIYQAGSMDLATAKQYTDKAAHDARWRAKTEFERRSVGLDELSADLRYSSRGGGESQCTVYSLKRNAMVTLTIPVTGDAAASPDQFKASCKAIAENLMPKLVDAALG